MREGLNRYTALQWCWTGAWRKWHQSGMQFLGRTLHPMASMQESEIIVILSYGCGQHHKMTTQKLSKPHTKPIQPSDCGNAHARTAHINVQLSTHARKQSSISMLGLSSNSNAHDLNYMNANNTRQAKLNQWPTHKRYWQQNNAAWQTDAKVCSNALNENWAEHKAEHVSAHAKHKHWQKQTSTCHCTHSSTAQEQQKHVCACAYWSSSLWISSCSQ